MTPFLGNRKTSTNSCFALALDRTDHRPLNVPAQICGRWREMMKRLAIVAPLLLLLISNTAFGQATTSLSGTVQDSTGALIPGVEIKATNEATGVETPALSNDAGAYNFAAMQPGTYTVRASLPGFQTRTFTKVGLSANQTNRLNFVLEVAGQATAVEVSI